MSPYGASELCGEAYYQAFRGSYDLKTVALRFGHVWASIKTQGGTCQVHQNGADRKTSGDLRRWQADLRFHLR